MRSVEPLAKFLHAKRYTKSTTPTLARYYLLRPGQTLDSNEILLFKTPFALFLTPAYCFPSSKNDEKQTALKIEGDYVGTIRSYKEKEHYSKLDTLTDQLDALKDIGFKDVDCFYK